MKRKPSWLRVKIPGGETHHAIKKHLRDRQLFTVCEEARCPNVGECWRAGTATIMILGEICTRGCRFCSVKSGNPGGLIDPNEPGHVAETVVAMDLKYVVLTCVDRDDLPDGGAEQFARVVKAIQAASPHCRIEVLVSDYQGRKDDIRTILHSNPTVFAHNIETTQRLTPGVRDPRASYEQSLYVLETAKTINPAMLTKSSLMLGLGETWDEILQTMDDLRKARVDIITLGQYLQPTRKHLDVVDYINPETFDRYADEARKRGFIFVASGPLVRSSYRAAELFAADHSI